MNDHQQTWESFALVLIDVQKDFWTDGMSAELADFETKIGELLALCRSEEIDVVHIRASFQADKSDWMHHYKALDRIPCIEGTPGIEVFDCAKESANEKVFDKQSFDGFQNPQLEDYLIQNDKRFVLVAGLVTSVCVLLTAATAAQRGYLVGLVEDCCADKLEAHAHTLQRYPFIFDRVNVDQILTSKGGWAKKLNEISG